MGEQATPRAIPEIEEELRGIHDLLHGREAVRDPAIRRRLGARRKELKDERIVAERLLAKGR